MVAGTRTDVFAYRDYRAFLRAYYEAGRAGGVGVSLRAFSRRAQLRSPNYLKLVMDGSRNLSSAMAARFAHAAGLRGQGAAYFCELVSFNQAKSADERDHAYERMQRFARYRKAHKLDAAQDEYHSRWYLPALRELVAHRDFRADPAWIARTLRPAISVSEAKAALETLLRLGLIQRDSHGGVTQVEPLLETRDGPLSHHVANFQRTMLERAALALDTVPREEREIASLTLCISPAQAAQLKRELERFRRALLHQYTSGDDATRVVQVNLQLFPLSGER